MTQRTAASIVLAAVCLLPIRTGAVQPAPDAWYGRMANAKNFDPPMTFANAFSIELPKNWQLGPGHTGTVFLMVEKTKRFQPGAAIILEYMRLQAPFDPSIIDALGPIELDDVKARELRGTGFTQQVRKADRPLVLIQYDRPGVSGGTDHVVQYSLPSGSTMYRLICIAPASEVDKYRPIFAHAAASFTALKAAS